jgi:hypothetical protein
MFSNSSSNANILSHPIVIEYNKTYDIIVNFKDLILKSLPNKSTSAILGDFHQKLSQIKMAEFDQDQPVTPQIIHMTTTIDFALNEIQIVFSQIIDQLVSVNLDIVEKDKHIVQLLRQIESRNEPHSRSQSRQRTRSQNVILIQNENDDGGRVKSAGSKLSNVDPIKKQIFQLNNTNKNESQNVVHIYKPLIEPCILFTRSDVERNERSLKKSIERGILPKDATQVEVIFFFKK